MCFFFKKLSAKEVYDFFNDVWKRLEMKGLPDKKSRNSENYAVSPYNTLKKEKCAYTMHVNCGKWRLHYNSYYDVKKKSVHFTVWYINLTITNPELQKQLRDVFKDFSFTFMPSAVIISSKDFSAKKIEDVKSAVSTFATQWDKSGIYDVLNRYKTNGELKNVKY